MHFFSYKAADLNHTVLGSEKDGGYIKLPSFSALQSQLGEHDNVVTQVCQRCHHAHILSSIHFNTTVNTKWFTSWQMTTFNQNPHPSGDNITGTVCSLLISDGNREIKLNHLTEMIEVRTVCFVLSVFGLVVNRFLLCRIELSQQQVVFLCSLRSSCLGQVLQGT